jgi:hypothetical protein
MSYIWDRTEPTPAPNEPKLPAINPTTSGLRFISNSSVSVLQFAVMNEVCQTTRLRCTPLPSNCSPSQLWIFTLDKIDYHG